MGIRQSSEQVGQDNSKEEPGKDVRPMWMPFPMHVRGLSVSVLLVGIKTPSSSG